MRASMYTKTSYYCNLHMPYPCPRLDPASGSAGLPWNFRFLKFTKHLVAHSQLHHPNFLSSLEEERKLVALSSIVLRVFRSDLQLEIRELTAPLTFQNFPQPRPCCHS